MVGYVDFGIDSATNDISFENGKMKIVSKSDEVAQRVRTRLRRILGEWFLDVNAGMPYFDGKMLGGKDFNYIKLTINSEIIDTEGVQSVRAINLLNNQQTRETSVYVEIVIDEKIYKITEVV